MRGFRSILAVFFLVAVIYGGYKLIPVYMAAYQFEDAVKEEAKVSVYTTRNEEDIRAVIVKRANELELPIQPEDVTVKRGFSDLTISVDYKVHVDMPAVPLDLKFHTDTNGHRLVGAGS